MDRRARGRRHLRSVVGFVVCCALAPFAVTQHLIAQELDLTGYVENTVQLDYTAETDAQLIDAGKLRIDLGGWLVEGLEFRGNVNLIVSVGSINRQLGPYLPDAIARELIAAGAPDTFSLDRVQLFLDNAFVTWQAGPFSARLGKQQLSWGPAYSFNPTDLFHRKNLLDPTYEKEGVPAVRAGYRWGVGGELSFIAAADERLANVGYALRLGTHLGSIGYDVALTAHYVSDSTGMDPAELVFRSQRRTAVGVEFSGTLLGLGVWLEGNYNDMELESSFVRVAAGFDYTLDDGTYLMAEALVSGRSEAGSPYPVHDWLANVYYGEPVGRGWLLAGLRRDLTELVQGSFYTFASPDGSVVLNPRIDASMTQNMDLVVFGALTFGNGDGAFPPGLYSVFTRATLYF